MTALSLAARPHPRRLLAAVAALAYAMPFMLAAVSDAGHRAFHLIEGVREREGAYTHTHGGVTHSHAGVVDALLSAADDAEGESTSVAPLVRLSAHGPASLVEVVVGLVITRGAQALDAFAPSLPRSLPPVPPPRA